MHTAVPAILIIFGAIFVLVAAAASVLEVPTVKTHFVEVQNISIPPVSTWPRRLFVGGTGAIMIACGVVLTFSQMALSSIEAGPSVNFGASDAASPPAASPADLTSAFGIAPQTRMSVVATADDSGASAFALTTDGKIASADYDSTQWGGFATLSQFPAGAKVVSDPAAVRDQNGHFEVFAVDNDGRDVLDGWQTAPESTTWNWDANVTGPRTDVPGVACGDPSAVLTGGGEVALSVRLSNGNVAFTMQSSANGTWTPWKVLSAHLPTAPGTAGDPVLAVDPDHGLDMFAVDTSGHLIVAEQTGSTWGAWQDLGTPADTPRLVGVPTPILNQNSVVEVYTEDADGQVRNVWWNTADSQWQWSGEPVGSDDAPKLTGPVTAVTWPAPQRYVELFAQSGHTLVHTWQRVHGRQAAWQPWEPLSPDDLADSPSAVMLTSGPEVVYSNAQAAPAYVSSSANQWSKEQLFPDGP